WSRVAPAIRARNPVDPAGPPEKSTPSAAVRAAARAGSPDRRICWRSSFCRSPRPASFSARDRRRYSCQSALDWIRTLGTLGRHPPLDLGAGAQHDPHPAHPVLLRARGQGLLVLLQGGAPSAPLLHGPVRLAVAALVRVPLVRVRAAPRAALGLVLGVPDGLVPVLVRPHRRAAEEMGVRDPVGLADRQLQGELGVALQSFPMCRSGARSFIRTHSPYRAVSPPADAAEDEVSRLTQSFSVIRSSSGRSRPMDAASSAGMNPSGFQM